MLKKEHSLDKKSNILQLNNNNLADNSKSLRADAKQNREQILKMAHKIFSEKGLSIPIGEIARQAGVGIGTVYRHFPTKEALFDAVIISYKQKLIEEAKSRANDVDPGKAFFGFFSYAMENGFTNRTLKDAFKSGTFDTQMAGSSVLQDFQSAFATLLTRAQQAKAVRDDIDVKDLMTVMSGLLLSIEQLGVAIDSNRFNRLLSIVSNGLHYNDTFNK